MAWGMPPWICVDMYVYVYVYMYMCMFYIDLYIYKTKIFYHIKKYNHDFLYIIFSYCAIRFYNTYCYIRIFRYYYIYCYIRIFWLIYLNSFTSNQRLFMYYLYNLYYAFNMSNPGSPWHPRWGLKRGASVEVLPSLNLLLLQVNKYWKKKPKSSIQNLWKLNFNPPYP